MLVPHKEDVDDVLQQTATRLWAKWDEYDVDQPFTPWAIKFAYFEVLSGGSVRRGAACPLAAHHRAVACDNH